MPFTDVVLREVKSMLYTLSNPDELYKVIKECKEIIEKRGLIRSDQSFKEMTKVILVKMNEERRVKADGEQNRFSEMYLKTHAKTNNCKEIDSFLELFGAAKSQYPDIYSDDDEVFLIKDNECLVEIIKRLESFSFLGTDEDIKGAVYEIFLKATLRGDFDQYFTPRELVDFMVRFADPNIGDKILDPACGSAGFLIHAFSYVNKKIRHYGFSEIEEKKKFKELVDKCLWGGEADYDLHVLAKINMIMHGDGWNNIKQGDSLRSEEFPDNYFDLILENPPFTIPYAFRDVLDKYELGQNKEKEELDILFVEKSIKAVKPGCEIYIVLPEGLMNTKKYKYFREYILKHCDIVMSISLPEGAFIPFGGSASKTCIMGFRKKSDAPTYIPPKYIFAGVAKEIGYETGKKTYKRHSKNDLCRMLRESKEIFDGIHRTENGGEYGWVDSNDIDKNRIDASYLLNMIERKAIMRHFDQVVPLKDLFSVENKEVHVQKNARYRYLEIPDISNETGLITNIRQVYGHDISGDSYLMFREGDILFTRINPKISRIAIAPKVTGVCITSKEVYRLVYKQNPYMDEDDRYCIIPILRSLHVKNQIIRLSTGSSSSRARVYPDDLLENVFIPLPPKKMQNELSASALSMAKRMWSTSQSFLKSYVKAFNSLGETCNIHDIRRV